MSEDPPRLLDSDPSSELGRALRVAQADVLKDDALARIRVGIVAQSAASAATTATAPIATTAAVEKASSFGLLAKTGLAIVVVGAGLGIYGLTRTEPARTVDHPPAVMSAAPTVPAAALPTAPEPARTAELASPLPAELASRLPAAPSVALGPQPRALPRPSPAPSADAVTQEGALLLQARRFVDTDPAKALAIVKKCEADFPNSQLAPERSRIASQAKQRLSP